MYPFPGGYLLPGESLSGDFLKKHTLGWSPFTTLKISGHVFSPTQKGTKTQNCQV